MGGFQIASRGGSHIFLRRMKGPKPQAISGSEKYWAFISYRHADNSPTQNPEGNRWADWLHQQLETFRVPPELVGRATRSGTVPARILPCFRDEAELPTNSDLSTSISDALDSSRYLIVICSPRAVQSRYVNEEIRYFKSLGRSHRILSLVIAGEPNASEKAEFGTSQECFPEALRFGLAEDGSIDRSQLGGEPLAADARREDGSEARLGRKDDQPIVEVAKLKLIAGVLGVGFDELYQREQQRQLAESRRRAQRLRRLVAGFAILSALAIAGAFLAWWQKGVADQRKVEAEMEGWRNRLALSRSYYDRAYVMRDSQRPQAALAYLIAALQTAPEKEAPAGFPTTWESAAWPTEAWRAAKAITASIPKPFLSVQGSARPLRQAAVAQNEDGTAVLRTLEEETNILRTWSMEGGALLSEHQIPGEISSAHLSASGNLVALQMKQGNPSLWNASTRATHCELKLPEEVGTFLPYAFSFFGDELVIGGSWTHLLLWDATTGGLLWSYNTREAHSKIYKENKPADTFGNPSVLSKNPDNFGHISSLAVSPDGTMAAFASGEVVALLDIKQRQIVNVFALGNTGTSRLQFLEGETKQLLVSGMDQNLALMQWDTGKILPLAKADFHLVADAHIDPTGNVLAISLANGSVQMVDLLTGRERPRIEGRGIIRARFPFPGLLVTTNIKGQAELFQVSRTPHSQTAIGGSLESVLISDDARTALLADGRGTLRFDFEKEKPTGSALGPVTTNPASLSPDGARAVHWTWDGMGQIWNPATGAMERELPGLGRQVKSSQFTKDGSRLIVETGNAQHVSHPVWRVFDPATGREVARHGHSATADGFFHVYPGGKLAVTSAFPLQLDAPIAEEEYGKEPTVMRIVDLTTGEERGAWPYEPDSRFLNGSDDLLVFGEPTGQVLVRNAVDGKEIRRYGDKEEGGNSSPRAALLSPDGKYVAVHAWWDQTSKEHRCTVYRVNSGEAVFSARSVDEIHAVFAKDGETCLVETASGPRGWPEVHFHNLTTGKEVVKLRGDLSPDTRKQPSGRSSDYQSLRSVCPVVLSPDGTQAFGAQDDAAVVLKLPSGEVAEVYEQGTGAWPISVRSDDSGQRCVVLCEKGTLRCHDRKTGALLWNRKNERWKNAVLKIRGDLLTITIERGVEALRMSDGQPAGTFEPAGIPFIPSGWAPEEPESPTSSVVLAHGSHDEIRHALIKDLSNDRELVRIAVAKSELGGVVLSRDGSLALIGYLGMSELLDCRTGKVVRRFGEGRYRASPLVEAPGGEKRWEPAELTRESSAIGEISADGKRTVWPGRMLSLNTVAASRDGLRLLAGHQNKVTLWNTSTRQLLRELGSHSYRVNAGAIHPDGLTAASGADDGTLYLWDLATGRAMAQGGIDPGVPILEYNAKGEVETVPGEWTPENPAGMLRRIVRVGFIEATGKVFAVSAKVQKGQYDGDRFRLHLFTLMQPGPSKPETGAGPWSLAELSARARLKVNMEGSRRGEVEVSDPLDRVPLSDEEAKAYEALRQPAATAAQEKDELLSEPEVPEGTPEAPPAHDPGAILKKQIQIYTAANRLEEGLAIVQKAISQSPDDVAARLALLDVLERLGRTTELRAEAKGLAEKHPGRADVMRAYAEVVEQAGDKQQAADAWLVAARLDLKNPEVQLAAAWALSTVERNDEALAQAKVAVALHPESNHWGKISQGWFLLAAGRNEEAETLWASLREKGAYHEYLSAGLAVAAWSRGDQDSALREYRSAIGASFDWALPAPGRIHAPKAHRLLEEVRHWYLSDPGHIEEFAKKADTLREKLLTPLVLEPWQAGNRSRAVENLAKALREYPNLGTDPAKMTAYSPEARATVETCRALAKKYQEVLGATGLAYAVDLGEKWDATALAAWEAAGADTKTNTPGARSEAWYNAGWLHFHAGRPAEALACWRKAEPFGPGGDRHSLAGYAMAFALTGDSKSTAEAFARLLQKTTGFLDADRVRRDLKWPETEVQAYELMLQTVQTEPPRYKGTVAEYEVHAPLPWMPITPLPAGLNLGALGEPLGDEWDLKLSRPDGERRWRLGVRKLREQVNVPEAMKALAAQEKEQLPEAVIVQRDVEFAGSKWAELKISGPDVQVIYRTQYGAGHPLQMITLLSGPGSETQTGIERVFDYVKFQKPYQ